jgi:hypothetical protein
MIRVAVFVVVALLFLSDRGLAQDRGGFTALVDLGAGVQSDSAIDEAAVGVAGVQFGVGAFVNRDLAVMFRLVGTTVNHDLDGFDYGQTAGFVGPAVQWWLSDRVNVEAGAGWGFWNGADEKDSDLGLLFGTGVSIFNRGKHNVQVGVQYVPAFTNPGTVHNLGFTIGYQFQ